MIPRASDLIKPAGHKIRTGKPGSKSFAMMREMLLGKSKEQPIAHRGRKKEVIPLK